MAGQTDTISRGQLEALKASIRATAETNPAGTADKGRRCAEIAGAVCSSFGVDVLAELPASCFTQAMQAVAKLAVPVRQAGEAEASLRNAKERLSEALADLLKARRGIAAFRHEAEAALLAPLKSALGVDGRGTLEAVVQDGVGILLSMPLLQLEHELDRAHEVLAVLGARLPSIGRALDERRPAPAMLGAD
jgi:hypothetical protein